MLPPLTVFDTETTGLDPKKGHRIVEIAGVRIENGIITEQTFSSFVNPEREIPLEAQRINHISNDDVINAPSIMTVLPEFLEFSKGSILFAHNAAFDKGFLENEKDFCWGYVELPEILCTMRLSQSLFPTQFRHNLDILSQRFELPFEGGRHRALPDVIQTAKILIKMLNHGKISSMDELRKRAGMVQMAAR
ncbi:3'-5' exonuclease [Candidatus Peribacteria bacterium]|nr:MAG: 3'-5' exonuclease [Candidatus Peribacteria bacterium]